MKFLKKLNKKYWILYCMNMNYCICILRYHADWLHTWYFLTGTAFLSWLIDYLKPPSLLISYVYILIEISFTVCFYFQVRISARTDTYYQTLSYVLANTAVILNPRDLELMKFIYLFSIDATKL
jgi:hypothetical protein